MKKPGTDCNSASGYVMVSIIFNDPDKPEFAYLRRSSLIKHTLTTTIIIANASEATNCPIAAAGIGCNGHGSMKLARHALNIQTTVRKK